MNALKLTLTACLIHLSLLATLHAQSGRRIAPANDEAIRIITSEVRLNVTVRDTLGEAVAGLQAEDFSIYDNGKRYAATQCEPLRAPLQIIFLFDETSVLLERAAQLNPLLQTFCRSLGAADRFAVMQFADEAVLTRNWTKPEAAPTALFTNVRRKAERAAIYDALLLAATKHYETATETEPRRVIILLTNGLNTVGLADALNAFVALQGTRVALYVFSETEAVAAAWQKEQARKKKQPDDAALVLPALLAEAEQVFTLLAERTGGKMYFPLQVRSLRWMLDDLRHELRSQYVLTYQPQMAALDGYADEEEPLFHQIRVLVRGSHQAVTRTGYRENTTARRIESRQQFLRTASQR
jgi:VWFA-related protein